MHKFVIEHPPLPHKNTHTHTRTHSKTHTHTHRVRHTRLTLLEAGWPPAPLPAGCYTTLPTAQTTAAGRHNSSYYIGC